MKVPRLDGVSKARADHGQDLPGAGLKAGSLRAIYHVHCAMGAIGG
jgi:hypothetical protein